MSQRKAPQTTPSNLFSRLLSILSVVVGSVVVIVAAAVTTAYVSYFLEHPTLLRAGVSGLFGVVLWSLAKEFHDRLRNLFKTNDQSSRRQS